MNSMGGDFRIASLGLRERKNEMERKVHIFDTTLRDGEQSPGATLNEQEKLEIARQLARLGVDVMEAGFPAASPGDLAAVKKIAETVGRTPRIDKAGNPAPPPIVTGLARTNKNDIDKAWEAVAPAVRPRRRWGPLALVGGGRGLVVIEEEAEKAIA